MPGSRNIAGEYWHRGGKRAGKSIAEPGPDWALFPRSGQLFGPHSAKNSTFVLGIPLFSVRLAIGGYIAAENDR